MRRTTTCAWILLAALPTFGRAESSLSWNEAVEMTAKSNAELKAARESLQSSAYREDVARSGFFPNVSGKFNYTKSDSNSSVLSVNQGDARYSASLVGTQNLFAGLQDYGNVRQAKADTRVAEAALRGVKAGISFDLKSAYENLYYAREYQLLTKQIIQRRGENLKLVELRFESGRENKGSVLLSKAYLNQAMYDDLLAKNVEEVAQTQLRRAMGFENSSHVVVQGDVPVAPPPAQPPDFERLALNVPEYARALAQEESSKAAVIGARSPFFPTLDLAGSIGKEDSSFFPNQDFWSVGASLSIPIFSGGKDYYGTKSAISTWQASLNSRLDSERQVLVNLRQSYSAFLEAVEKLKVDESFRKAAEVRAEIARNRYNNGLLSFEDWDIIENDLIARQRTYLQSTRDRVVAEASWERSQGVGALP